MFADDFFFPAFAFTDSNGFGTENAVNGGTFAVGNENIFSVDGVDGTGFAIKVTSQIVKLLKRITADGV